MNNLKYIIVTLLLGACVPESYAADDSDAWLKGS